MIAIGERIIQLRKARNWSQDDLAKEINASRVMVGKYERADSSPSIDVIVKLAEAFDVSVDYLLGVGLHARYSKDVLERVDDIENLPEDERQRIFDYIDLVTRDYQAKRAYKK